MGRTEGEGCEVIEPDAVATIPGPDPDTKPPKRRAPKNACDCHFHIFGAPAQVPLNPRRKYTPAEATLDQVIAMHDELGIGRMVIVQPSPYGADNAFEGAQVEAAGAWARGVAVIDPAASEADLDALPQAGFRAARFNLASGGGTPVDELGRVAARAAEMGWHMEIHVEAARLAELAPEIGALPGQVVVDHMSLPDAGAGTEQPGFQALLRLLGQGNIWVKVSAPYRIDRGPAPWPKADPFARALIAAAPERCLWGSDWPHTRAPGPMPNDGDLFNRLLDWTENDDGLLQAILVDNPAQLYGF